ncbi:uncharacterized protein LOC123557155 [Mercenaria mercenaria]|uniref:uncharacterized protein LOC123557155 n=1 Tax=Mercenaria mercenaria TaxID=6596 RepID=UPI00234E7B38|nr:uncharacterized protein LOC123557155 [Mercenaria mercenaria]
MTDVVKNIYTFANILSAANTDCVQQWDRHSVFNALKWANYCMKVEEETRNKTFRDDLDRQIQSMTILLKPVSLLQLSIDKLSDASLVLSKSLSQNPDTPADVLATLADSVGDTIQNVKNIEQNKVELSDRLYQFVGEDVSFMEQSHQSQAEYIMHRLVTLQRACVSSQHRYDKFLKRVLNELQKYRNGWTVIMYMFLTDVTNEEDYDVITGIKTNMLHVVSSMARDFDCGIWRCDCLLICKLSTIDDSFCDMYVDHLLSWAVDMVPVYGLFNSGDIYRWRHKEEQLNIRYSYTELQTHLIHIFHSFRTLKMKVEQTFNELSKQTFFNVYKDLLKDCDEVMTG